MKLENWAVIGTDPYKAPEAQIPKMCGNVFGNPKFDDGKFIIISSIIGKHGNKILTTNSEYELGVIDPEYSKEYENARKRLFDSLTEV